MPEEKGNEGAKKMKMLTIFLPTGVIDIYDDLVKVGIIPNRSEGFRMAITDYMMRMLEARRVSMSKA